MLNQTSSRETLRLLCCAVAGETYCLDTDVVRSVERTDLLQLNPSNDGPAGWLLGSRTEIPVFSLADRLNLPRSGYEQRVIVVQSKQGPWGLLVDRVSSVVNAPAQDVQPLPSLAWDTADFFRGVLKIGHEFVLYLEPSRLHPLSPMITVERVSRLSPPSSTGKKDAPQTIGGKILLFSTPRSDSRGEEITFGLSLSQVLQILDPLPLMPLLASSKHLLGLVNWRDCPVPLADLNSCLGLDRGASRSFGRLMIARATGGLELVAFGIKPTVRMQRLPTEYRPCGRHLGLNRSMIKGAFELKGQLLVVPDLDRIVSDDLSYTAVGQAYEAAPVHA